MNTDIPGYLTVHIRTISAIHQGTRDRTRQLWPANHTGNQSCHLTRLIRRAATAEVERLTTWAITCHRAALQWLPEHCSLAAPTEPSTNYVTPDTEHQGHGYTIAARL